MNLKLFLSKYAENAALVVLLLFFLGFTIFIAFNLNPGIIPDERAHFIFSRNYATTIGIPPDTHETYSTGWYIEQNPFLYYWINGRVINLVNLVQPVATDWQLLVSLRLLNVIYALGSIIFCYLTSIELIKKHWWRLLPIFMLINTLMFVFLSGGLNYDNLANLASFGGIYFLARVLSKKDYLTNSLAWMVFISLGTLVKYTILPLALAMTIIWLIYSIINRQVIFPFNSIKIITLVLAIVFLILTFFNMSIYGVNIIRYRSLTPACRDILLDSQCEISPYERRFNETALERRMTIQESIAMGYPNPITYAGKTWVSMMIRRTIGIAGHLTYYPDHLVKYFQIMVYGLAVLTIAQINKLKFKINSYLALVIFYTIILLIQNYRSELTYGFQHIALQGRYIFPVIGAIYVIIAAVLLTLKSRLIQIGSLIYISVIFLISGPITFILNHNNHFTNWFIR